MFSYLLPVKGNVMEKKLSELLSKQVVNEFYSAYLYLQMAAWFEGQKLKGSANWMRIQAQEESSHALIMFNHLADRGVYVKLGEIPAPESDFKNPEDVLKRTLKHEQGVTKSIHDLVDLAIEVRDHAARIMLEWFVIEQVEEENNAEDLLEKFRLVGPDKGAALLALDATLASRTFTVPGPLANAEA